MADQDGAAADGAAGSDGAGSGGAGQAGDATAQARRGVRDWVRAAARRSGARLSDVTPYGILAFLTASALAPIAAGIGAGGLLAAAVEQLGQIGGGYLSEALIDTADRMRGRRATEAQWRDALAEELLARLADEGEQSQAIRAELGELLRGIDAVEVALAAAAETDAQLRDDLAAVFQALGHDVGALRWMLTDVHRVLGEVRRELAKRSHEQRVEMDRVRRQLLTITQLSSRVQVAAEPQVAPDRPEPGSAATDDPVCPFPGLAAFEPEDAPWFHGRQEQIAQVLSRLAEQAMGGPPLIVTGVSGVGKSSVLRAGVLPAIAAGALGPADRWPWLLMTPGARPLDELVDRTLVAAGADAADLPAARVHAASELFGALAARAAPADGRLVIVVDQFEELFTECTDPAHRLAFVTALAAAAPAVVVIAVRADFYADCAELPPLAHALAAGHLVLGRMNADQLRRAVTEPAARAGLEIEPGLVELLLTDLNATAPAGYDPGALPLLGHALRATWQRRDGRRLTVAGYRATGGIRRAVAESAERIHLDLDPAGRIALRTAMLRLVTVTDTGAVARRRGASRLFDADLLSRLVRARLVTVAADTVEISHEALLTNWPRLDSWLAEARDELIRRQRLTVAAEDWRTAGRDPDLLLRGTRLALVRDQVDRNDLSATEVDFLSASVAAAEAAELARLRGVRRLRRLTVGLAAALLLAVAGGLVAVNQQAAAEDQRRQAISRQLAAESQIAAAADDDLLAVGRALDAWDQAPTVEAYGALLSAQAAGTIGPLGTAPGGLSTAVSPDGTAVAVGHQDGLVRLWDVATLRQRDVELRHATDAGVVALAFSPDGRFLASGSFSRDGVRIWDVSTGQLRHTLPAVGALGWLPTGATVVAGRLGADLSPELQVGGWSATTGELQWSLPTGMLGYDLTVNADGTLLAVANPTDGDVQVWQLTDQTLLRSLPAAQQVAFGPDDVLVTSGPDGALHSWSVSSGERTALQVGPFRAAVSLAVTPDGSLLTTGGWRTGRIDSWALTTGVVSSAFTGYVGRVVADVAVAADGRTVAVTGPDAPTVLFRRTGVLLRHPQSVQFVAVDPAAERVVTAAGDDVVRIWDLGTRAVRATVRASDTVTGVAVAGDGTFAVSTTSSGVLRYTVAGELVGHDTAAGRDGWTTRHPAYSPDGRLLAVAVLDPAGQDGGVLVWRLDRDAEPTFLPTGGAVSALGFGTDGTTLLATANHGVVSGDETVTRAELRSWHTADLSGRDRAVIADLQLTDLAVSPDGHLVAVARSNGQVELRTVAGLDLVGTVDTPTTRLSAVAFSPDGERLVTTAVSDDLARVWQIDNGELTAVLVGHVDNVNAITFTRDGLLVSGSTDTSAQVWDLDPDRVAARLCDVATPAARAVGDEPPRRCR